MIDLSGLSAVVSAFADDVALTVLRPGAVVIESNRRVEGDRVAVSGVVGSCWPVTGSSIDLLPEGKRERAAIDVYTLQELQIADDATGDPGDVVVWRGNDYEVVARHSWSRGEFFAYVAQMVRRQ